MLARHLEPEAGDDPEPGPIASFGEAEKVFPPNTLSSSQSYALTHIMEKGGGGGSAAGPAPRPPARLRPVAGPAGPSRPWPSLVTVLLSSTEGDWPDILA